MRRLTPALAVSLVLACGDDPVDLLGPLDCPELDPVSTSAILLVTARFHDVGTFCSLIGSCNTTSTVLWIDGFLAPGVVRNEGSCTPRARQVTPDTLEVMGFKMRPLYIRDQGSALGYGRGPRSESSAFDTLVFAVGAVPAVEGLEPILPQVRWRGVTRVGPDTIALAAGEDLLVEIGKPDSLGSNPPSTLEQWTLEIRGDISSIQLTASGPPPDTLVVPAEQFPSSSTGRLIAQLSYARSATADPTTQPFYHANYTLEVLLRWVVQIGGTPEPPGEPALVPAGSPTGT